MTIQINPLTTQMFLHHMGLYITGNCGEDTYSLLKAIMEINSISNNQLMTKTFGDDAPRVQQKIIRLNKHLHAIKIIKETIRNENENKKAEKLQKLYHSHLTKIPIIQPELYALLATILQETPLNKYVIPSSAFKTMDKNYRKLDYGEQYAKRPTI